MADYIQHILDISIKHHATIQRLYRPLELLGIDYVAYQAIKADGTCHLAINRVDFGEFYLENKIYEFDPFLRHPCHSQSGLLIADYVPHQQYNRYIRQARKSFAFDVIFTLIEKQPGLVEFFCFAAKKQNPYQLYHYLSEIKLFKQYAKYFLQESNPMLQEMQLEPTELLPLLGDKFNQSSFHWQADFASKKQEFLKLISTNKTPHLTQREKECLLSLAEGHTAKQTALSLNISYRTVEQFIDKLKQKFHCQHKRELIKVARQLQLE